MAKFNKKKLPSRHTSLGADRAPHRSFYYAMGETEKDVAKPFVGVVSTWNEAAPCNIALMRQAQSVKKGVRASGGTPREFCTITVTDGIAMGHEGMKSSLVSREIIADSTELTVRGHCYDALVGIAGCDKSLVTTKVAAGLSKSLLCKFLIRPSFFRITSFSVKKDCSFLLTLSIEISINDPGLTLNSFLNDLNSETILIIFST